MKKISNLWKKEESACDNCPLRTEDMCLLNVDTHICDRSSNAIIQIPEITGDQSIIGVSEYGPAAWSGQPAYFSGMIVSGDVDGENGNDRLSITAYIEPDARSTSIDMEVALTMSDCDEEGGTLNDE